MQHSLKPGPSLHFLSPSPGFSIFSQNKNKTGKTVTFVLNARARARAHTGGCRAMMPSQSRCTLRVPCLEPKSHPQLSRQRLVFHAVTPYDQEVVKRRTLFP